MSASDPPPPGITATSLAAATTLVSIPAASATAKPTKQTPREVQTELHEHIEALKRKVASKTPVKASLKTSPTTRKRPYRRTKRPKNYNDKSTITTTTDSVTTMNAYDAVLAESQDLMTAAKEAQQLGRLKMASAYLLLLHARIVGLGKRFDKAYQPNNPQNNTNHQTGQTNASADDDSSAHPFVAGNPRDATAAATAAATATATAASPRVAMVSTSPPDAQPQVVAHTPKTKAARELAKMLPSNIELDTAMMEHLAKAAAELHAARSGRRSKAHHSSSSLQGSHGEPGSGSLLQSAQDAREFLANTANQQGVANAATMSTGHAAAGNAPAGAGAATGIAWSQQEKGSLEKAVSKGCRDPKEIAKVTGRTEQQVKAYLRNQTERARVEADLELPLAASGAEGETPKKKGGRGRKPATTAMNTVPNANCNARTLLQGGLLGVVIQGNGGEGGAEASGEGSSPADGGDGGASATPV